MRIFITGASGFMGTGLVEHFANLGYEVANYDMAAPHMSEHRKFWIQGDLLDRERLIQAVADFRPDCVINAAAKTGAHIPGLSAEFFAPNTRGVENLIDAIVAAGTVKRSVFVSSLLVCRNGYIPNSDTDYCAPNPYGQSKVDGEMILRGDKGKFGDWVIVRPSSVWGPWFEYSYKAFFKLVGRGLYFHISGAKDVVKPITFVGNTAYMLERLLLADRSDVTGKTFYLVDWPETTIGEWADTVQQEVGTAPIRTLPRGLLAAAAKVGDILAKLGWHDAPLTTFRLNNMQTGGHYPFESTRNVVGPLPYSLRDGVRNTVRWMRAQGLMA